MTIKYASLDVDSYEIRVLVLHPSSDPDTILSCDLKTVNLFRATAFSALSYCWGDEAPCCNILINGCSVQVTRNLHDALRRLQELSETRVWIDALCINQNDRQERGSQIRLMKEIYSRAQKTYAWLGSVKDDGCSASALEFLGNLQQADKITEKELAQIPTLMARDYWRRRWIIQEITASSMVRILCDRSTISLSDMARGFRLCQQSVLWHRVCGVFVSHLERVLCFRDRYQSNQPWSLCAAIHDSRAFQGKERRDMIFALLGICQDGAALVPLPNYTQNDGEIVRDLSRELVRQRGYFDVILADSRERMSSAEIPTWVLDWLSCNLQLDDLTHANELSGLQGSILVQRSLEGNTDNLRVQGIMLATIHSTTTPLEAASHEQPIVSSSASCEHSTLPDTSYYGKTASDLRESLFYCLIYDAHEETNHTDKEITNPCYNAETIADHMGCAFGRSLKFPKFRGSLPEMPAEEDNRKTQIAGESRYTDWLQTNRNFSVNGWILPSVVQYRSGLLEVIIGIASIVGLLGIGAFVGAIFILHLGNVPASLPLFFFGSFLSYGGADMFRCGREARAAAKSEAQYQLNKEFKSDYRLATTSKGMLTMVSQYAQPGDKLCFIAGCKSAAVLREKVVADATVYEVVGRAHVCLSKQDKKRYKDFPSLKWDQDQLAYYQGLKEWREFVLI